MIRRRSDLAWALVLGAITTPAAAEDENADRVLAGWGRVVDPKGDCTFHAEGERLAIEIPGTRHDLSAEAGDMNAPRVLREIRGDFIAQVKIAGEIRHDGERTSRRYLAYQGAGLLLWLDETTYVRLERAAVLRREPGVRPANPFRRTSLRAGRSAVQPDEDLVHYVNFELRHEGEVAGGQVMHLPQQATHLRLERRGVRIIGSVSQDGGIRWVAFTPMPIELPDELKLGVAAINTSTDPFQAELEDFALFLKTIDD